MTSPSSFSNGKSRSTKRRRRKRRYFSLMPKRRLFLLLAPFSLLLCIWLLLIHRVKIYKEPQKSLEGDPLLPMPLVVERHSEAKKKKKKKKKKNKVIEAVDAKDESQSNNDVDSKQELLHNSAIPNVISFTHSVNLLNTTIKVTDEDVALQRNVRNTIKLHPGATVHFLTDEECIASIQRVLGSNSALVEYFRSETHGMYKADICRGATLYETGGLYFDVDIQARMNMFEAIPKETTFVTPMVHRQSKYPGAFFQAFIGVTPENPIMMRYLELFILHYQGHVDVQGPLGVLLLRRAHDEVMKQQNHGQHVSLWQEVLYNKQMFPNVPPPSWGTRRACHFVVVANRKRPFLVPLYSRVKGSRMCGGRESVKNLRGG